MIFSLNTLRLWLPQIYQAMNDYQYYNNGTSSFCAMLDILRHKNETVIGEPETCVVVIINKFIVWININLTKPGLWYRKCAFTFEFDLCGNGNSYHGNGCVGMYELELTFKVDTNLTRSKLTMNTVLVYLSQDCNNLSITLYSKVYLCL